MKKMINFFTQNNLTAPFIILGIFSLLFALVIKTSVSDIQKTDKINVTGSTERYVKSDTAKWNISISKRVNTTEEGYSAVNVDKIKIKNYLIKNGIGEKDIVEGQIRSSQICNLNVQGYENCALGISGYNFYYNVIAESNDVDNVYKLQNNIMGIFPSSGITSSVEYYFNNLKNIRVEMLSEATKNARERAQSVADAGGATLGNIKSVSSGVFQVTSKNSVSYDDSGAYDTNTIDKKVTATVKAEFSIR